MMFEERHMHDDLGNCEALLDPKHKAKLDACDFYRAGGDKQCETCGKVYYDHPNVVGALWLTEICSGELVKL